MGMAGLEDRMYALRPATEADRAFLYRLHRATMKVYVEQVWGWDEDVQVRRFDPPFDPQRYQIVVVDGRDVGAVLVEHGPEELILADLKIDPAYQRRGLGTAVIQDLLQRARERGVPVALQVLKVNPALLLYERLGFTVTGETSTHYLMRTTLQVSPSEKRRKHHAQRRALP